MTDFVRRLVSGNKARFKDAELKLELDLVYVTDQIIIMGYPASGFEGYYRNRKEDVKKFLDHRHGTNYWIFNFCPLKENSYDAQYFGGRVSRFPFPDHHAPPLAIMPLVAREMNAWLSGSPDRVAVLHCKAGKGRSGTMACTYLLSLGSDPAKPQQSDTAKEKAKRRAEETMDALPENQELEEMKTTTSPLLQHSPRFKPESDTANIIDPSETGHPPLTLSPTSTSPPNANPEKSFTDALKGVLDLHTARRMKAPSHPEEKQKQGVSIPSQRRYLHYWALLLAYEAPPGFWSLTPGRGPSSSPLSSFSFSSPPEKVVKKRVRLTEIKLRLRELSTVKLNLLKAANIVIDKTKGSSTSLPKSRSDTSITNEEGGQLKVKANANNRANQVWVSLARYDDEFIATLENWERFTRDEKGRLGVRRPGSEKWVSEDGEEIDLNKLFTPDGEWDKHKMVRSFAKLGEVASRAESQGIDKDEKIVTYTLQPLNDKRWESIKNDIKSNPEQVKTEELDLPQDENASISGSKPASIKSAETKQSATTSLSGNLAQGIVLDAEREVRVKLYMGQVFMGWIWLIPAFHMPYPTTIPNNNSGTSTPTQSTIRLTRKEVDFPIGLGAGIVDVELSFEWVTPSDVHKKAATIASGEKRDEVANILSEPPVRAETGSSDDEPTTLMTTTLGSVVTGSDEGGAAGGSVRNIVDSKQGAGD